MATTGSGSKVSKRSGNTANNRTRKSKRLQPCVREAKRARKRSKKESQNSALDSVVSLADRVQAERKQLFKALAIVECCKYASTTSLELNDFEFMVPAFESVCDLLNASAGELERIANDWARFD